MARPKTVNIDLDTAHRLKLEGIPTADIARQLKLPVRAEAEAEHGSPTPHRPPVILGLSIGK